MAKHSVIVWDNEAQGLGGTDNEVNRWGPELLRIAIQKAGPKQADKISTAYSRRNDTGNGVIFEWD